MSRKFGVLGNFKLLGKWGIASLIAVGVFATILKNQSVFVGRVDSKENKNSLWFSKNKFNNAKGFYPNHRLMSSGLMPSSEVEKNYSSQKGATYYLQMLGEGEALINNLALWGSEENLASNLYDLLKNEEMDQSLIGSFFGEGFKSAENLLVQSQRAFVKGESKKGEYYLGNLSSLLGVLNGVREKMSDSLRDYSGTSESEVEDLRRLGFLHNIGVIIIRYNNWVVRMTYSNSQGDLTLTKMRIEELQRRVESVEADKKYLNKRSEKIDDADTRWSLTREIWSQGYDLIGLNLNMYKLKNNW